MTAAAKVLIVDDSVVVRGLLTRLIDAQAELRVVGSASNGKLGVEKVRALEPDVVVLDIEMPVMTGLEALVEIRKTHPKLPIVMFSTLTERGASAAMKALELGASDYATKPSGESNLSTAMESVKDELVDKILGLVTNLRPRPKTIVTCMRQTAEVRPQAVVVGSSTGGPMALEQFLAGIGQPLPIPLFITQHMPPVFTKALADRLNGKVTSTVVEAESGMKPAAGTCYIAPGGFHMSLSKAGGCTIEIKDGPTINSCRPSVEPLFRSAAEVFGRRLIAVMLTGMGADGLDGSGTIAELGSPVLVQDEATSVVWGMPGAVAKAGFATEVLPLTQIGRRVREIVGRSSASAAAKPAVARAGLGR